MAYLTYTTEALVCGSRDTNTSDRSFLLFTRDAGMVWATARSVREERSKQRYALQDFSFIRVSLVRGKSGWRVGSVQNEVNVFSIARTREARAGVLRIVKLLRQFVQGEEPHPALYADVYTALTYIADEAHEHIAYIADRFSVRMLYKLGYIAAEPTFAPLLEEESEWVRDGKALPDSAQRAIAHALSVSHL